MAAPHRPRLGITLGDPAGIGPEVALKALADESVRAAADVVVFGCPAAAWQTLAGAAPAFLTAAHPLERWDGRAEGVTLIEMPCPAPEDLVRGRPSAAAGEASIGFILAAVEAARSGRIDAIVTGPISKEAIHLAGYPWPGHTELLAEQFAAARVAMMFAGGPLKVILATIHVSLAEAIRSLSTERIVEVMRLADAALKERFGIDVPRLGVCGLNPHAGEAGRFGFEEREIIAPAIERARAEGLAAFGPLAPDTAFHQALRGRFDLIVAMYHDQGLIPLKTVAFEESVNVTLGLPIVRTSVDHGTAYDIAGRGQADPRSMKAAVRMAADMVARRREVTR